MEIQRRQQCVLEKMLHGYFHHVQQFRSGVVKRIHFGMLVKPVLRASNFCSLFYDVESYYVMEVFLSNFFIPLK